MSQSYLPSEVVAETSRTRLFQVLLLTAGFVVLFNFLCVWYLDHYQPNQSGAIVREKWSLVESHNEPHEWLILGDSTGNQGVSPEWFRKQLGQSAINLCTLADMGTVDDAWILECYLRNIGRPDNILVVHAFDCWPKKVPSIGLMAYAPFEAIASEQYSPIIPFRFAETAAMYAYRYCPLYFQNLSLADLVKHPRKLFRKINFINGFLATRKNEDLQRQFQADLDRCLDFVAHQSFDVSQRNHESLKHLIEVARLQGISVFLSCGPICETVAVDGNFREYYRQMHAYLASVAFDNEHVHVVTPAENSFGQELFEGTAIDHVTEQGAAVFTLRVIAGIQRVAPELRKLRR